MKKQKIFLVILLLLLNFYKIFGQPQAENYLTENLNAFIDAYYQIDTVKQELQNVLPRFKMPDSTNLFYPLLNENYNYSYTLMTFASQPTPEVIKFDSLEQIESLVKNKKEQYINDLMNNKKYKNALLYYLSNNSKMDFAYHLDTISLDELLNITSKYFYVRKLVDSTDIKYSVCGGAGNPYRWIPGLSKDILAEAFSFQALGGYLRQNLYLIDEINETIKPKLVERLKNLDNTLNYNEKLAYIQKQMCIEVLKYDWITTALMEEYKRSRNIIPIVIQ